MGVAYDSKQIIPAPFVHIGKQYVTSEDGTPIDSTFLLTVKGKLSVSKGSPNSQGVFWTSGGGTYPPDETGVTSYNRLTYILRKQEALRKLFATQGRVFEIDPIYPDSSTPLQCNPRVKSIEFAEGPWYEVCDYTITLEADTLRGATGIVGAGEDGFAQHIQKAQEDWAIEAADELGRTYRLTHTLSATGKRSYDADGSLLNGGAWQSARAWVQARMGIDASRLNPSGNILNCSNPGAYNFLRAEHVNEMAGTYTLTETWLVFDATGLAAPAIEDYTVSIKTTEDGRTHGNIEGNIRGLEVRNNTTHELQTTRITNAQAYWANVKSGIFSRVQSYTTLTLNPLVLNSTVGENPITGVITYSQEYNNRPTGLVTGSITERISVNYDNPSDVVAQVVVLGRALGPVPQPVGTVTVARKTLTIEAQMPPATMDNPSILAPNTTLLVASFAPITAVSYWLEKDTPNFDYTSGRYTRTVTWAFEGMA